MNRSWIVCIGGFTIFMMLITGDGSSLIDVALGNDTITYCSYSTCKDRCGSKDPVYQLGCFCHPSCYFHGDCCPDYELLCGNNENVMDIHQSLTALISKSSKLRKPFNCYFSHLYKVGFKYISTCSSNYQGGSIKQSCEATVPQRSSNISLVAAVYDDDDIVYKNQFCAECNNIKGRIKLVPPNFYDCTNNTETLSYVWKNNSDALISHLFENCKYNVDLSHTTISTARYYCRYSGCLSEKNDICLSFRGTILNQFDQHEENSVCLFCNPFFKKLKCFSAQDQKDLAIKIGSNQPSFTLLLDFTDNYKYQLTQTLYTNEPFCSKNQFLDLKNLICVNLNCWSKINLHSCSSPPVYRYNGTFKVTISFEEKITLNPRTLSNIRYLSQNLFSLDLYADPEYSTNDSVYFYLITEEDTIDLPSLIQDQHWNRFILEIQAGCDASIVDFIFEPVPLKSDFCSTGKLKHYSNIDFLSKTFSSIAHNDDLFIWNDHVKQAYPLTSVGPLYIYSINNNSDTSKKRFDVYLCESLLQTCAKTLVDNTSFTLEQTGQFIINSKGKEIKLSLGDGEYIITEHNELVFCTTVLEYNSPNDYHRIIQAYLTSTGVIVSSICLVITVGVLIARPLLNEATNYMVINLCISLACAQTLFGINQYFAQYATLCYIVAIFQHFSWLSSFSWSTFFSYDVAQNFVQLNYPNAILKRLPFVVNMILPNIIPLLITLAFSLLGHFDVVEIEFGNSHNSGMCWISPKSATLYAFAIPIAISLTVNLICFVSTICVIIKLKHQTSWVQSESSKLMKTMSMIAFRLSSLMGFSWLVGFLANISKFEWLWYCYILANSTQGVLIMLSFINKQ